MIKIMILIFCIYFFIKKKNKKLRKISKKNQEIMIFGHRGAPDYEKENTILSFQKAIKQKADGIELDVQKSSDNHIVIHHDEYLNDNVSKIQQTSFSKIQKIQKTHKLNELKDITFLLSKIKMLNIEIKSRTLFNRGIEKDILKYIETNKIENKTIISSFNPIVLFNIKRKNKKIKIGYLFTKEDVHWILKTYMWAKIIKPNYFNVDKKYIDKKIIKWCKKEEIPILVFTINTKEDFLYVKKLGVQGVFTDNPQKIKLLL